MRSKEHGDFTDEEMRIFDEVNKHLCSRFGITYPNGVNRFMMDCNTDPIVAAYSLSPREWEVSCLMVKGLSRSEIADSLSISKNTLKRHIANIYHKMGVSNEMQFFAALNRVGDKRGGVFKEKRWEIGGFASDELARFSSHIGQLLENWQLPDIRLCPA